MQTKGSNSVNIQVFYSACFMQSLFGCSYRDDAIVSTGYASKHYDNNDIPTKITERTQKNTKLFWPTYVNKIKIEY